MVLNKRRLTEALENESIDHQKVRRLMYRTNRNPKPRGSTTSTYQRGDGVLDMTKATKACARISDMLLEIAHERAGISCNVVYKDNEKPENVTLQDFLEYPIMRHTTSETSTNQAQQIYRERSGRGQDSKDRGKLRLGTPAPVKSTKKLKHSTTKDGHVIAPTRLHMTKLCVPWPWNGKNTCFVCGNRSEKCVTCIRCGVSMKKKVVICHNLACWVLWHNAKTPEKLVTLLKHKPPELLPLNHDDLKDDEQKDDDHTPSSKGKNVESKKGASQQKNTNLLRSQKRSQKRKVSSSTPQDDSSKRTRHN